MLFSSHYSIENTEEKIVQHLKTYLRNTIGENCLNGLALLNNYVEKALEPSEILDLLAHEKGATERISIQVVYGLL